MNPETTHAPDPTNMHLTPQRDAGPWEDAEEGYLPVNFTTQAG